MKRVTLFLVLPALLIWCSSLSVAVAANEGRGAQALEQAFQEIMKSQGVSDVKSIDCSKVTQMQMEDLGEAFMDVMHPDPSEHAFVERMMGGETSPMLTAMKRLMGGRYLGCYTGDAPFLGMAGPAYGRSGYPDDRYGRAWPHMPMMYGNGPWGMMGGYGGWIMWILFLVILAFVVYLVMRWARPEGTHGAETPLDILKKRYAKGEITHDEFEEKKKILGL